jgi:hypothetical protein
MLFVRKWWWWRWLLLLDKGREHPRGGEQLVVHVRRGLVRVRVRAETGLVLARLGRSKARIEP